MTEEKYNELKEIIPNLKRERSLPGDSWKHSHKGEPNYICESRDFINICLPQYAQGPFAVSFANEEAKQDVHYHRRHLEIYFSEYNIGAKYKSVGEEGKPHSRRLDGGGVIIFGPEVIHEMALDGLTIIIEVPSVDGDKEKIEWRQM